MPDRIRTVIFDMDGVLIDAKDWHYEALNRALGLFGYEIGRYDHLVTYDGLPTRTKLEMLSRERGLPQGLHPLIGELKQLYTTEIVHSRCKPTFQHQYLLSRLKAMGYRLAVASNAVGASVELMMRKAHLIDYFDCLFSNEDVSRPKPDPEIYQLTMARLEVTPGESLIVEDNPKGIQAAHRSGAHVLEVETTADVKLDAILARIAEIEHRRRHPVANADGPGSALTAEPAQ